MSISPITAQLAVESVVCGAAGKMFIPSVSSVVLIFQVRFEVENSFGMKNLYETAEYPLSSFVNSIVEEGV